ncbi:MAG: NUDIX hydrolase [Candidatus Bathyarchaeota archaeon]|nr:NUDIX hydrolase [Candidatus Bathyarchaeum tardum]WGM88667.1 MAG: NUDIX hydrolase [Candidatus Bathyarchaeum tardum]WNZ29075.1 MAG: NUDIX hydrolase [Candidatus Bathyarchaeota archaeon]
MRRAYPVQPVVGVGAVVVDSGKILLVKRGVEPSLGKWSFPGGAVELGECVRDAVLRETNEETCLEIELIQDTPLDAYDIFEWDKQGKLWYHYVLLQFLGKPKNGVLKPTSDAKDAKWVPLNEANNYDLAGSVRHFLQKHMKQLKTC